jgi:50S ribosomal subunit-associated GTPase HflX
LQHIESVDKILSDLGLEEIPQIIALNKSDLLDVDARDLLKRQIVLDKHTESVAISAIHRNSLNALTERIAASIGDFGFEDRIIAAKAK